MISVIIPVYNVEDFLTDCLESVVNQSYTDKEVLLIDDGSIDSSLAICKEYARQYPYIRVIHKDNGGPSSTRNRGIEEAKGDWIIFLDSDDVWNDKDCLRKLYDYAVSLKLDIVRFEYQAVNLALESIEPHVYNKSDLEGRAIDNYAMVKYAIDGEWFGVLFLMRRTAISSLRFNEEIRTQEDIDFYVRLFAEKRLRCGYLHDKMYLYRKRDSSISKSCNINNMRGSFRLCDVFYNSILKVENNNLKNLYRYNSIMMYYWTLQTLASDLYYKNKKIIIEELNLEDLHKRVVKRMKETNIEKKYYPFIIPAPSCGVKLLHFKDKIRSILS